MGKFLFLSSVISWYIGDKLLDVEKIVYNKLIKIVFLFSLILIVLFVRFVNNEEI